MYGRKSATHDFCLRPTSQNQRAETSSSRWASASRDRPERPRNMEEKCEHVEHRQTIRNSTDNIKLVFVRTNCAQQHQIMTLRPTSPYLGCRVLLRGVPSASRHPYCELKVVTHGKTLWKNAYPTTFHVIPVRSPDDDHLSKISVKTDDKHLHIPRVTPNMATNHEHLPIHHDRDNVCCKEDVLTTTEDATTNHRQLVQQKEAYQPFSGLQCETATDWQSKDTPSLDVGSPSNAFKSIQW